MKEKRPLKEFVEYEEPSVLMTGFRKLNDEDGEILRYE